MISGGAAECGCLVWTEVDELHIQACSPGHEQQLLDKAHELIGPPLLVDPELYPPIGE